MATPLSLEHLTILIDRFTFEAHGAANVKAMVVRMVDDIPIKSGPRIVRPAVADLKILRLLEPMTPSNHISYKSLLSLLESQGEVLSVSLPAAELTIAKDWWFILDTGTK